jgi:Tol biopolymer transport system component
MPGLVLFLVLIRSLLVEASGLNVNSQVSFTPLTSTYRVIGNATGCPAGFSGKFTFAARLQNNEFIPGEIAVRKPGLTVRVTTLTNGNVMLDPQTGAVLGGVGAVMEVPKTGEYTDGVLGSFEKVDVPFVLCLKTLQPFQFFVNVLALVTQYLGGGVISADGRYVAFISSANPAPIPSAGPQVFVRDLDTGTTKLASVNLAGTHSGNRGIPPFNDLVAVSANGRYVAFLSFATDLVAVSDTNEIIPGVGFCDGCGADVFVRDMQTGTTMLASIDRLGTSTGNKSSFEPVISPDGRFVAFSSLASDLVPNDTNGAGDVFVRDLQTLTTTLVSTNQLGTTGGNNTSFGPVMSANARFVVFQSYASDLVATDTNGEPDVFVRDLQTGTTTLVSMNRLGTNGGNGSSGGPSISADGRFVSFTSGASDLVFNDTNAAGDVFVRDLQAKTTTLVSANRLGTNGGNNSSGGVVTSAHISANGRFVAFPSFASDLVATDTNGVADLFVRDLQTGTTTLVTVNRSGTDSASPGSQPTPLFPAISADGRYIAFVSFSADLVAGDFFNDSSDGFVRDVHTGTTTLVGGVPFMSTASISADGSRVLIGTAVHAVW